jgi:hypothetical protein
VTLFGAHRRARRAPFVAIKPDSCQSATERYLHLVSTVARNTEVVLTAQAQGALSGPEALVALRRQAGDLLVAIALLDAKGRP